jgi:acetyltransferase-like isoleucine patch superfamily enzyme
MATVEITNGVVHGIDAEEVTIGRGVQIGQRTQICAKSVFLGDGVAIDDDVTIAGDKLRIGAGTHIGANVRVLSPTIEFGERCRIGSGLRAELNEHFVLGRLAEVGHSVRIVGQGLRAGDHFWLTDMVVIGGGGARGPRSYLVVGDRSAVMERCYINLSDTVTIGTDTALSNGVTILTHSMWQPTLDGGSSQFAPVQIGSRCILYVNAIVAPGVTIGDDVTVAAGALVIQKVPDGATAIGNPARVMRATPPVPRDVGAARRDAIVRETLRDWTSTLAIKGVRADYAEESGAVTATFGGITDLVWYAAQGGPASRPGAVTISLAFGAAPAGAAAQCHFDLSARTASGTLSPLAEDLRDFLRRRTIRIYSDRPFRPLPAANLERLRARLRSPQ